MLQEFLFIHKITAYKHWHCAIICSCPSLVPLTFGGKEDPIRCIMIKI